MLGYNTRIEKRFFLLIRVQDTFCYAAALQFSLYNTINSQVINQ